ncbi:hypothetical protein ACFSSB_03505 [Lacinutrix gracilariae]|uniref:DUF4595 domain-containing protein n=1 Tax=Lacinutrix gracilariae TaxID=1747198 RepID=A0ABW5K0N5_9FLAO
MKKLNILFTIFLGISILSCSSSNGDIEDNTEDIDENTEETIIVYKKATQYAQDGQFSYSNSQEVFYNTDKKIIQVVTYLAYNSSTTTTDVIYNSDEISEISKTTTYENSNNIDIEEYDVIINNGQIKLTGVNGLDKEVQIDFTENYVDAIRTIQPSNLTTISENLYQRNNENNIISYTWDNNISFTYSNFDTGNVMPFHGNYWDDYFIAFALKPSKNLPLTSTITYSSGSTNTHDIDPTMLTYDNENNIIHYAYDSQNYTDYEYIEL